MTRNIINRYTFGLFSILFTSLLLTACGDQAGNSSNADFLAAEQRGPSPDGIWTFIEPPEFPSDYSPPREFAVATVDDKALQAILAQAPPELSSAPGSGGVRMSLPLPDQSFATVNILGTQIMERVSSFC